MDDAKIMTMSLYTTSLPNTDTTIPASLRTKPDPTGSIGIDPDLGSAV